MFIVQTHSLDGDKQPKIIPLMFSYEVSKIRINSPLCNIRECGLLKLGLSHKL